MCLLSLLCDFHAIDDAYEHHKFAFLMNHNIWTQSRVKLGVVYLVPYSPFGKPNVHRYGFIGSQGSN